jgi:hypothetical protein
MAFPGGNAGGAPKVLSRMRAKRSGHAEHCSHTLVQLMHIRPGRGAIIMYHTVAQRKNLCLSLGEATSASPGSAPTDPYNPAAAMAENEE